MKVQDGEAERGRCVTFADENSELRVDVWWDSKERGIIFVSSGCGSGNVTVGRREGADIRQVPAPPSVEVYNTYMVGVDTHDAIRSSYSIAHVNQPRKWWKKVLLSLIDLATSNAYILCRLLRGEDLDHGHFMRELAEGLAPIAPRPARNINLSLTCDCRRQPNMGGKCQCVVCQLYSSADSRVRASYPDHWYGYETAEGAVCKTKAGCGNCGVYLCRTEFCWMFYHQNKHMFGG